MPDMCSLFKFRVKWFPSETWNEMLIPNWKQANRVYESSLKQICLCFYFGIGLLFYCTAWKMDTPHRLPAWIPWLWWGSIYGIPQIRQCPSGRTFEQPSIFGASLSGNKGPRWRLDGMPAAPCSPVSGGSLWKAFSISDIASEMGLLWAVECKILRDRLEPCIHQFAMCEDVPNGISSPRGSAHTHTHI